MEFRTLDEAGRTGGLDMRAKHLLRAATCVVIGVVGLVAPAAVAGAGPSGPPDFGVVDPLDNNPTTVVGPFSGSCPWPNFVVLEDVGKCLPSAIAWSEDGVRTVSDPLVDSSNVVMGHFTFWCQSRTGLRFIVTVEGLDPNTVYTVTAAAFGTLAQLRTDPNGNGVVGGTLRLDPGSYETSISVGTALSTRSSDPIGFEVF